MSNEDNVPERILAQRWGGNIVDCATRRISENDIEYARVHSPSQTTAKEIDWITNKFAEVLECPNGMCTHCVDYLVDMSAIWEKRISVALNPAPTGKVSEGDEARVVEIIENWADFENKSLLREHLLALLATVRTATWDDAIMCVKDRFGGSVNARVVDVVAALQDAFEAAANGEAKGGNDGRV